MECGGKSDATPLLDAPDGAKVKEPLMGSGASGGNYGVRWQGGRDTAFGRA